MKYCDILFLCAPLRNVRLFAIQQQLSFALGYLGNFHGSLAQDDLNPKLIANAHFPCHLTLLLP